MGVGTLVVMTNPWKLTPGSIGIVIEEDQEERWPTCNVLWTTRAGAKVMTHLVSSLTAVSAKLASQEE